MALQAFVRALAYVEMGLAWALAGLLGIAVGGRVGEKMVAADMAAVGMVAADMEVADMEVVGIAVASVSAQACHSA